MDCPACGSSRTRAKEAKFENIHVCADCEFIFAEDSATSSSPELYNQDWSKTVIHPTYIFADGRYMVNNPWRMHDLLDKLEPFRKLNKILDVGCSAAFFLKTARERGWEVQGVEVAGWAAKYSNEELGIPVFNGLLQDAKFSGESFDVVCSSHVIEHVSKPKELVTEMRRLLRPGGALVTTVPTQFRTPRYVFKGKLSGEGPPRHVSFFNRRSLEGMLTKSGFRIHSSRFNVELKELLAAVSPKKSRKSHGRATSSNAESKTGHSVPRTDLPPPIRILKRSVNHIATAFEVGDEVCTIAIKE